MGGTTWFRILFLLFAATIFRKIDTNFAKIDRAIFYISLLLYIYRLMAFVLMSKTKMTITLDLLVQS